MSQKKLKKYYRLTVWSFYDDDSDEPYFVDCASIEDAYNSKYQYENELTISGQHAYAVCGPDVVEVYE